MSVSAALSFPVTLAGMVCPAHAGLMKAPAKIQRAVVQGSVVVAVVLGVEVGLVVVVVGWLVVDPPTRIGALRATAVSWLKEFGSGLSSRSS
jgi:hypothetical protein